MLGKIKTIETVQDYKITHVNNINGEHGQLGVIQMINAISGFSNMDGYKIQTEKHLFHVLIDSEQNCCENWGYLSSEDDLNYYIGANLLEVNLVDAALNKRAVEDSGYYEDNGGIQFVNFVTDKGTFQLAVYNAHNGYYGHGIVIAKDEEILLSETL